MPRPPAQVPVVRVAVLPFMFRAQVLAAAVPLAVADTLRAARSAVAATPPAAPLVGADPLAAGILRVGPSVAATVVAALAVVVAATAVAALGVVAEATAAAAVG
ncbi:hypothetical protein, partial [Mycobacterium montefiorense]|uniref:hypothetical protein n=2 Tax=Mycobacterium montefiorense TaxID=154654 RepID=UPI0021C3B0A5